MSQSHSPLCLNNLRSFEQSILIKAKRHSSKQNSFIPQGSTLIFQRIQRYNRVHVSKWLCWRRTSVEFFFLLIFYVIGAFALNLTHLTVFTYMLNFLFAIRT